MKTLILMILALGAAQAQTLNDTFTFGPIPFCRTCYIQPHTATITSWNGDPNAFPQNMGGISLAQYPYLSTDISIPWQLGFPNNGYMQSCATMPSQLPDIGGTFVSNGDGTGTQDFVANQCYDGGNTTITATINYKSFQLCTSSRTGTHCFTKWAVTGGSGTVTYSPDTPSAGVSTQQSTVAILD